MRTTILHRHDISDKLWNKIEKVLPGRKGSTGRPAMDNRKFLNAVFWILRTGAPWRDLPPEFGDWKNTHRRFSRWRDKGIWEKILTEVTLDYDTEWIMIDSTYCKCHQHAAGARGGNQAIGLTKGGRTTKLHLAVDSLGLPLMAFLTAGNVHDSQGAIELIKKLKGKYLIADKAYDSQDILDYAKKHGMEPVIPPRKSRKQQRFYDKFLYKARHAIENLFLKIKQWRGVACRYTKNLSSFQAVINISFIMVWSKLL